MKTHEELVQTARVLHKALKVDLTIYDGDRNCIVKFTKNPYPEELCGKLWEHPEKMWKHLGKAKEDSVSYQYFPEFYLVCMNLKVIEEDRELLSVSRTISDGALFRAACLENSS